MAAAGAVWDGRRGGWWRLEALRIGVARVAGGCESRGVVIEEQIPWLTRASRGARWLVGVSGGADSVALLHLLVAGGFRNLIVCHLDHRLRGRVSTEDARFVRRLADKLGLGCEVGRIDVGERMRKRGNRWRRRRGTRAMDFSRNVRRNTGVGGFCWPIRRMIRRRRRCGICYGDPTV